MSTVLRLIALSAHTEHLKQHKGHLIGTWGRVFYVTRAGKPWSTLFAEKPCYH